MTTYADSAAYTPHKPRLAESSDQLRARIPGWGVDLDPADRPSVPREQFDPDLSGARWEYPELQPETFPRERSLEHAGLTPVFGTAQPLHGVSGAIRRLSYARYSEGRAAHWMLLIAADRVDTVGSVLRSFLTLRPDNPVTETGVLTELSRNGARSRMDSRRADTVHHWIDPVIVGGPWVVGGIVGFRLARRVLTRRN
jgi:hypothetical protein